jgi:hypothetical protein
LSVYQCSDPRLAGTMLSLAAALLIAPSATTAAPDRQARATVRIIRVEPILFQEIERRRPSLLRSTYVRTRDGNPEPARLLEYQ